MSYVTGISGNVISAASAGWAPTNSAEVSAIASAYATGAAQVVTAVGTETAITPDGVGDVVTSINGNYISALSADYAYQAATDYLGRDLSGLPSEYDISSIASAYAASAQVVTSLQYATSESATVDDTVTAETYVGAGARDISAEYLDYGTWAVYDSSNPLVKVRMTAYGTMSNYSSYPYYLYMVPYGVTNQGNVSQTSQLTGAREYGAFSGDMNDLIIAEGYASSLDPYRIEVTFDVTHVPFWGSNPAWWGTVPEERYTAVDNNENSKPVFCVAGGYDGSQLFEIRDSYAEVDFGSIVTVSAVSGINNLSIAGAEGGIDSATVSAIASSYAEDVSAAASGAVWIMSINSADWMKLSSFSGVDGIVTAVGSSTGWSKSASAFMGVDSAIKSTTGSVNGVEYHVHYPLGLDGYYPSVKLSSDKTNTYVLYTNSYGSVTTTHVGPTAIIPDVSGDVSAYSDTDTFHIKYTADSIEQLAFQGDLPTYQYDAENKISSIDGSAIAGGAGGIDSATCSAIASAYAESAVSAVSGDYYSTSNPSGFIDSAYVDSAVSGKADESALSGYYTTANESGFLTAASSDGGVQVYATGTETSTNQFSAANASAGASLIAGTKARVRLWDSDYTGNIYASSIQTWNDKLDGSAIQYVAGSADATANGVLYILTGNA